MTDAEISALMPTLTDWSRHGDTIVKTYRFQNYYETMAFVNAVAWISHRIDHHPDLTVGYNQCKVVYTTHAIGSLSHKDFACAAKLEALFLS
jgi:4a-hydroxytetrahydrobiopterin dehydratase